MKINDLLKKYIETNIFPRYSLNDKGHGQEHIDYVVNRSLKFAEDIPDINIDMVYTIAAYHDLGCAIDRSNHEKISGEILSNDNELKKYFTEEEIQIMAEAVEDHRASMEGAPRSIYGKIVSTSDRNADIISAIKRTYSYRVKNFPEMSLEEVIEDSRKHLHDKFGLKGYANEKIYFQDEDYIKFSHDIEELTNNPIAFRNKYIVINKLEDRVAPPIKVGQILRHFKGSIIVILAIVNDSESKEDNKIVIYQQLNNSKKVWARPYSHFLEEVNHQKYPDIKQRFRFTLYEPNKKLTQLNNKLKKGENNMNKIIDDMTIELENELFRQVFSELKEKNPQMSLDELLYATYNELNNNEALFEDIRPAILEANGINEYEYYTKLVNPELKQYIEESIFPKYEPNDKAHGIVHILEVIRRSFALNDTMKLGLDHNMIYAIAACHDIGKYIDSDIHEKLAAEAFIKDPNMKKFFTDEERTTIKEAIEDHRSSKEDQPRTIYGELISSADRNTRIEIVFIRSFFVAKARMPEMDIEEYLDYTHKRLSKRYGEENPENMFLEDETYRIFLNDMRALLANEEEFKNKYCEVNHITDRHHKVNDEAGEVAYTLQYKK